MSGLFLKTAPRADLVMAANAQRMFPFVVRALDTNDLIDYTGSTFELRVAARDSNSDPTGSTLLTLETGDGISGTVANGEITCTFAAAALTAGAYVYQIVRLVSGAVVENFQVGRLDVTGGIA